MRVIIAGAGIGGLTAALALHEQGADVTVHEAVRELAPLGVGINVLPHAMGVLAGLDATEPIREIGVETAELCFFNRHGQLIWREPRGLAAGYDVPQISVHRGRLQMTLLELVRERLGADAVRTGRRVVETRDISGGVEVEIETADGPIVQRGDVAVAADGIHSAIRARRHPDEGLPHWSGNLLWRGTTWADPYLTGRSMFMAGHRPHKFVAYPISSPREDGRVLVNWIAELDWTDVGLSDREDWNRTGELADFLPRFEDWTFDWLDVPDLIRRNEGVYEFPMVDREPLDRWSVGRTTLLGDAAHPMYPIGSNGASQAILDARALADALTQHGDVDDALRAYEADRLPPTAAIVRANRRHGPEVVLDLAHERAPDGFTDVGDVFAAGELEEIAGRYKAVAGFQVRKR
ncbi:MAG: flavin-dependent oxidoreductase [Actinomycetota bacterium]